MKGFIKTIKWTTAMVLIVAMSTAPVWAEKDKKKTTPATDKNSAVPAVPRAIPDLIPYHKFDPPKSKLFDINKLTISGDLRVRPEFRNNNNFGNGKANTFFVQQWTRLGFNYSISPDVTFFFQAQHSKNWGRSARLDANDTDANVFARQGFMLIRNFLVPNLTVKAGRQLVVWGNHRMFGHFDWNNVGWSHDGLTANYKINKMANFQVGWLRTDETNCGSVTSGGCGGTKATDDADVIYIRAPMKVMGLVLEPTYIWHSSGTGGSFNAWDPRTPTRYTVGPGGTFGPRPSEQSRHTIGGRAAKNMELGGGVRLDATIEGYYQFGKIGLTNTEVDMLNDILGRLPMGNPLFGFRAVRGRVADISAYAFHVDAGVTLPVLPMDPRLGVEYNTASGNSDNGKWGGFDQLYPTNHIHFGYMDRMSWKNMNHYSAGLQLRPDEDSHLEVTGHFFSRKETTDFWYGAAQTIAPQGDSILRDSDGNITGVNTEKDIGKEIDVVYTHFFTPDNHVGWQIGGGVFFPGEFVDMQVGGDASKQTWGYTQLWINF